MSKILKIEELRFVTDSLVDSLGRVFILDDRIFRMINKESEEYCRKLLNSELFKELLRNGYIPRTRIDHSLEIEGHPLVLEHARCVDIKPNEWSFEMYKDAAIFTLKINQLCNEYGYELKDAHPFNITFNNCKPVLLDIGSIVPRNSNNTWIATEEFVQDMYLPLLFWRDGNYYFLRSQLESPDIYYCRVNPHKTPLEEDFCKQKISALQKRSICRGDKEIAKVNLFNVFLLKIINGIGKIYKRDSKYEYLHIKVELQLPSNTDIEKLELYSTQTEWNNYQPNLSPQDVIVEFPRFERIAQLFLEYCEDANTMTDLAGNSGALGSLFASKNHFKTIISIDYDSVALDKGYNYFKLRNNTVVNTVLGNCIVPYDFESTTKRLKSEIVFALAITHHLILRQNFSLDVIFSRIRAFSTKYVMIEFMPMGLWGGEGFDPPAIPDWYNFDWFKKKFEEYYDLLHFEEIATNRIVFVGRIR